MLYENSQADGGTASQIATNFAGKDVDLMCVTQTDIKRTKELLRESFCDCCLKEGVANL